MNRRGIIAALVGISLAYLSQASGETPLKRFTAEHATMGTTFRFIVYSETDDQAQKALAASKRRLNALNASLSDYVRTSEISRLSAAAGRPGWRLLSEDATNVLGFGQELAARTNGAFDVTVGPLTRLWRNSRRTGKLPQRDILAKALEATGHQWLEMDRTFPRARGTSSGMRLDLGGIAKGYAVDEALETLAHHGVSIAVVDGGGDLRAAGRPPGAGGWQIQTEDLDQTNEITHTVTDLAVATSGDLHQSIVIGNREFSHLIDPRTGLGLEFRRSVTVLAPTGMMADALASALSVLPTDASALLLQMHYPECAAQVLTLTEGRLDRTILGTSPKAALFRN